MNHISLITLYIHSLTKFWFIDYMHNDCKCSSTFQMIRSSDAYLRRIKCFSCECIDIFVCYWLRCCGPSFGINPRGCEEYESVSIQFSNEPWFSIKQAECAFRIRFALFSIHSILWYWFFLCEPLPSWCRFTIFSTFDFVENSQLTNEFIFQMSENEPLNNFTNRLLAHNQNNTIWLFLFCLIICLFCSCFITHTYSIQSDSHK